MTRKVICPNEELLVQIDQIDNCSHMLKRKDIGIVKNVVSWLHGLNHEVFLGGSAATNWIHYGIREYNDIDLLSCPTRIDASGSSEPVRLELIRACHELAQKGNAKIGRSLFTVADMGLGQVYLCGSIDGRFKLSSGSSRKSDIDLSIVSRENFYI